MKSLFPPLAGCAGVLLLMCSMAKAATAPTVVNAEWEQVEYIELPDGSVQVRARRKAVSAAPAAPAAAVASAVSVPVGRATVAATASANEKTIVDSLKDVIAPDLSVPSSPAMAVLDMSGTEIQRPAFPRDFAFSLIRGLDKDGQAKNALALDFVPVAMFFPDTIIGGQRYEDSYFMRLKARTTVSLAAAKVESGKPASQFAAGIRLGLIDYADPGLYWRVTRDCVNTAIAKIGIPGGRSLDDVVDVASAVKEANKCTLGANVVDLWAKPALYAGFAQGWYSDTRPVTDAQRSAKALWASFSVGIPRGDHAPDADTNRLRTLFQFYLARKIDDRAKDPAGGETLVREQRSEATIRLRLGKEKWHAFIDGGAARVTTAGVANERIRHFGLGVEYQLREDLWLVAGSVTERGYARGDRNLVNTGLRFGQVPKAQFGLPGARGE